MNWGDTIKEKGRIVERELFSKTLCIKNPNLKEEDFYYHSNDRNPTWDCRVFRNYFQPKCGVPDAMNQASTIQVHQIINYQGFAKNLPTTKGFYICLFSLDDIKLDPYFRNKILHHVGRLYVLNKNDLLHNIPWQELKIKNDQRGKRYIIPLKYFKIVYEDLDKIFPEIYNDLSKLGASNYQKKVAS